MKTIYSFNGGAPAFVEDSQRHVPMDGHKMAWVDEDKPPRIGYVREGDVVFIAVPNGTHCLAICSKEGSEDQAEWLYENTTIPIAPSQPI